MTAYGSAENAVEALKAGAFDYLTKPVDLKQFRIVVASARNWAHYMARMIDGLAILAFYAAVYRLAVIPRVLAGFGVVAAVLQIIAVAMPLFHRDVVFAMLAPLGLCQLIVAVWLIVRGFQAQPRTAIRPRQP